MALYPSIARRMEVDAGCNAVLVATFDGQTREGVDYRAELEMIDRDRAEQEILQVMTTRTGPCG
jgi:hypothetical protein